MPGTKRKASFAFPYERPAKLVKNSTSTTVTTSGTGKLAKSPSVKGPRFTPLKFPSLKAARSSTREIAMSSSGSSAGSDVTTLPSLRRASTLTLDDSDDKAGGASSSGLAGKKSLSKTSSKKSSKTPSLTKRTSDVEPGSLVTRLSGLHSGSIVGETTAAEPEPSTSSSSKLSKKSSTKKLSSKKSSVGKAGVPSVPSGLTKLALAKAGTSLNVSNAALIDNVDENEVNEALASLKSVLSKEKSKTDAEIEPVQISGEEDMEEEDGAAGVDPAMPPGGYLDIAISFDTTGSMSCYIDRIKAQVQNLVQRLQADVQGIQMSIIAHGDYCDVKKYIVKWIDFGASLPEICEFVNDVESTYGGDGPECYELVLKRAREALSWRPGSQRVLIMIGDDIPHEPGYTYDSKTYYIDWREECKMLADMGVRVYGVQADNGADARVFYTELAKRTSGRYLQIEHFESCFDFLMMICYREGNPDMLQTYEEEMRARDGRLKKDVSLCMAELAGGPSKVSRALSVKTPVSGSKKAPVKAGKRAKKTEAAALKKPKAARVKAAAPKKPKAARVKAPSVKAAAPKKPTAASVKAATKGPKGKGKVVRKRKVELKAKRAQKREKVPDSKVTNSMLNWSQWVCAILPEPKGKAKTTKDTKGSSKKKQAAISSQYTSCRHLPGLRLKSLFDNDTKTAAIYEFAVQCGESRASKKHVMYYRRTSGWKRRGLRWDMYLLRHKNVRAEVNKALESGFSIWVRRGEATGGKVNRGKKMSQAYQYIRDNYDYAWKTYIWRKTDGKQKHREVKVGGSGVKGAVISHGDI